MRDSSRQALRYGAAVLAAAAAVALLGGASTYSGPHGEELPDLLARVAIFMVGVCLPGALLLYRPIGRFLNAPGSTAVPESRIRRLPMYSAAWIALLAGGTISGHLGATHGAWRTLLIVDWHIVAAMLAHVALFAAYIGMCAYFLLNQFTAALRAELWTKLQIGIAPGRGQLVLRLAAGLAAVAAGPAMLLFSDSDPVAAGEAHHDFLRQAFQLDLLAAGLFTIALAVLVARSVTRPVRSLAEVMSAVDAGDLRMRAAVLSDDEMGALTARFNRMLDGMAERERMRSLFGRFVPEAVAGALLQGDGALEPQERDACVLHTDIERFTDIAAALQPHEVLEMLNEYFEKLAQIIQRHGGAITQFQGDAVLAVFNLPLAQADHAIRALAAARDILGMAARSPAGEPLRTRVGVAAGKVVAGTVGGGQRLGYTVHGSTVNLAARLEQLNKEFGTLALCDARTAELAGEATLPSRGEVSIRGFPVPVRVLEIDRLDADQSARMLSSTV